MTDALVLLTAHFIGDFVCQSDEMATKKSKDWGVLVYHVAVYTAVVGLVASALAGSASAAGGFAAVTFALHFLTDAVTSRITSKLWFLDITPTGDTGKIWRGGGAGGVHVEPVYAVKDLGTRHWFFVMIGFDQLLHVYALLLTWAWLVR